MPVGSLVTRVFRKELRSPAKHVRTQNAGHAMYDLGPGNNISQERVVQMAIIIVDSGARLSVRIDRLGPVKELQTYTFPVRLHLIWLHQSVRPDESSSVEFRQFLRAKKKGLRWLLLCRDVLLYLCWHHIPPKVFFVGQIVTDIIS